MNILISGAGIAGPTLAYWLLQHGHQPTIVETAPQLRTGGYLIDFWGLGYDIAEKMGILPDLMRAGYIAERVKFVDDAGKEVGGFAVKVFQSATHGRYVSLPRSELSAAIYRSLGGRVETLFADRITEIADGRDAVQVKFERSPARAFDLVIGADGLHSNVRRLKFGDEARFEKYLGYGVAAFELDGYRPRDELTYVSYSRPGVQVARFAMRDDRTLILLVYAEDRPERAPVAKDLATQRRELHARFDEAGWECPQIMQAMDRCTSLYVDRVSQIRMDSWSDGRVALIGDAAACPSLLAGQGSALAMIEAYVLASELHHAGGDHRAAFSAWETRLRPFLAAKQKAAAQFASSFAPRTRLGIRVRNLVTHALKIPFIADRVLGNDLRDQLELPPYMDLRSARSG